TLNTLITQAQSNIALWLRADSVIFNGSNVATWIDVSGHGRNAYQKTTGKQPLWVASITQINNQPAIRFDGIDDELVIDSAISTGEMFVVANWNGTNTFSYNGILTSLSPTYILIGATSTSLYAFGPLGTDIFINCIPTVDF